MPRPTTPGRPSTRSVDAIRHGDKPPRPPPTIAASTTTSTPPAMAHRTVGTTRGDRPREQLTHVAGTTDPNRTRRSQTASSPRAAKTAIGTTANDSANRSGYPSPANPTPRQDSPPHASANTAGGFRLIPGMDSPNDRCPQNKPGPLNQPSQIANWPIRCSNSGQPVNRDRRPTTTRNKRIPDNQPRPTDHDGRSNQQHDHSGHQTTPAATNPGPTGRRTIAPQPQFSGRIRQRRNHQHHDHRQYQRC
ncbi:MAG: hypothetical protein Ct9H300mP1_25580 [Planctomycetaceae bacterium]|nr:MAG: hypothetical protein Ct9H300mP1_25580 [Planctomycetaceae bacterium]